MTTPRIHIAIPKSWIVELGTDWNRTFVWRDGNRNPVDLTGFTARLQARTKLGGTVLLDLTTENGGITLGGAEGTVSLDIARAVGNAVSTDGLPFRMVIESVTYNVRKNAFAAPYDLKLYDAAGKDIRFMEGDLGLSPGVTADA